MRSALAFLFFASAAVGQGPCAIKGRVVDKTTGRPLANVRLFAVRDRELPAIRTTTNQHGAFCFVHLDPGSYNVLAQRTGYLDEPYAGSRDFGTAFPLLVMDRDGWDWPVTLKMTPRPILAGRVVDADGDPVAGAEVRSLRRVPDDHTFTEGENQTVRTDVHGAFRFYDLNPGKYYLTATPNLFESSRAEYLQTVRERGVETYYPNSLNPKDAAPIVLKAGGEVTGITIKMQIVGLHYVSGKFIGFRPSRNLIARLELHSGALEYADVQVRNDGTFYLTKGLLPEKYTIQLAGVTTVVDLTAGDVEGLLIEPLKPRK
ncbi:MAG: carboxypeptidase-like regulatory domain-containing protein [Bryobacteraceae bacterium]